MPFRPTFRDRDEAACYEAGEHGLTTCCGCNGDYRDGDMHATERGLVCESCDKQEETQ